MWFRDFGSKRFGLLVGVVLFVVAFMPRAVYSVTPNLNWYGRSIRFWDAVLSGNWIDTFQQYHPGVPTMWLSGLGIRVFGWLAGYSSEELLAIREVPPGVLHQAVSAGVIPLAAVISLLIVLVYFLLAELTEKRVAVAAAFLIALDPFFITHSKSLHLDALISILMLVTLLLLLLYRKRKASWTLVAAGFLTGMALLTKSPTALVIPVGALLITSSHKLELPKDDVKGQWQARLSWFSVVIQKLAIWGVVTTGVFFAFWPAMWVAPQEMLIRIYQSVMFHALTPHPNPVFFNGITSLEDPGAIYYGAVFLWRTTLVTFLCALIGLGALILELKRKKVLYRPILFWLLLFGVVFLLQMEASAKKLERYVLPLFLILDVVAAFGVVELGRFVFGRLKPKNVNMAWGILLGGVLIIQAGLVLPYHPYYGNNYNVLFGGIEQAQHVLGVQSQSEGIDLAGQYLVSLPDSADSKVAVFSFGIDMFVQYFGGNIEKDDDAPSPEADYRVYYNNQVVRGLGGPGWTEAWEADRLREPEHVITFDDIPFVWIYKSSSGDGG